MGVILRHEQVPIGSVTTHPDNYRQGDVGAISQSLEHHGQYRPIVVSDRTGHIVAGNHTYLAAKALGWDSIEATIIDVDADGELRILAVDNRTSDLALNDDDALAGLLTGLLDTPQGLSGTGFDTDDLDGLLEHVTDQPGDNPAHDHTPQHAEPITQPGDVWQLGDHLLHCSDAFDTALDGDVIITDPPYGMNLDTDFTYHKANPFGSGGNQYRPVAGDDTDFDPTPLLDQYGHIDEQIWFGADYYRQHLPPGGSWYVWDKRVDDTMGGYTDTGLDDLFGSHFELAWSRTPHKREMLRYVWSGHHGLQREDTERRIHPTQKPVALLDRLISITQPTGIIDPFAGSGSTLIAAHLRGIPSQHCELDPTYCDLIVERWRMLTGDEPHRLD